MKRNEISRAIIGAAIEVHRELGPGLLESTYETCLEQLLLEQGFRVQKQVALPVVFRSRKLDAGYRVDLLVEDEVIVEIKAVDQLAPIHQAQVLTYLRLSGKKLGLLINFNVKLLRQGIKRLIL